MANEHTTLDQATTGYKNLGSWTYGYDAASNPLSAAHAGDKMDELESTQDYGYDTLNRLITARPTETQDWTAGAEQASGVLRPTDRHARPTRRPLGGVGHQRE
ncbi:MAG: hypothetical protein ACE5F9_02480 [Phycisphaerae bacterium]